MSHFFTSPNSHLLFSAPAPKPAPKPAAAKPVVPPKAKPKPAPAVPVLSLEEQAIADVSRLVASVCVFVRYNFSNIILLHICLCDRSKPWQKEKLHR